MGKLLIAWKNYSLQLQGILKREPIIAGKLESCMQLKHISFSVENPCMFQKCSVHQIVSKNFLHLQRDKITILPSFCTLAASSQSQCLQFRSESKLGYSTCTGRGLQENTTLCGSYGGHLIWDHGILTDPVACYVKKYKCRIMPSTRNFCQEPDFESYPEQTSAVGDVQQIYGYLKEGKWGSDIALSIEKLNLDLSSEDFSSVLLKDVQLDAALGFFRWARSQKHYETDSSVYMTVFKVLSDGKRAGELWWLVHEMQKNGISISNSMLVTVMELYASTGRINEALRVFENFKTFECSPTIDNYNFILNLLLSIGNNLKMRMLYDQMRQTGCSPDTTTYTIMIGMHGKSGRYDEARKLLEEMASRGCTAEASAYATLIKSLGQAGKVDTALQLFNEMKERNVTANEEIYCYIIDSLAELGKLDEANMLFQEMEKLDLKPSSSTCICLITGFIKSGKQAEACTLLDQVTAQNHISKSAVEPVVIKLRKMHKIDFAWDFLQALFLKDYRPDAATHYFLVHAFCMAKRADLGLKVFKRAVIDNEEPPLVATFNVLIESLGKVDLEGARQLFNLMKTRGCVPDVVTYNSVIELLLRANLPNVAYDVFQQMIQQNCQGNLVTYKLLVKLLTHSNHVGQSFTALNNLWKGARVEEAHNFILELSRKGLLTFGEVDRTGSVLKASS